MTTYSLTFDLYSIIIIIAISLRFELIGGKMHIKYFQKGFNYSQDGPGNRLVYHLHGCNLRCPWCSNPEGMLPDREFPAFPVTTVSVEELAEEIRSCRPMFFDGGGVTFTGGEVSLQLPAVIELFKILKEDGINTAIETNAENRALPELFPFLDHLIMDLKSADGEKLKSVTGGALEPVLENLSIAASSVDTLVHIPLIHGFNDSDEDIKKFIDVLSPFKDKIRVEFLAYHEYGKDKWAKCELEYTMADAFLPKGRLGEINNQLKAAGINAVRT